MTLPREGIARRMDLPFDRLAVPAVMVLAGAVLGWLADILLVARIRKASAARGWVGGETTARAIHGMLAVWGALSGGYFAIVQSGLSQRAEDVALKWLYVAVVASATLAAVRLAAGLVSLYTAREDTRLPSTSIFVNITRIVVLALGALVALNGLGISITPLLTALGVGGLAVALALQDTLGNLFAGLNVIASHKIGPGDFIRVQDGVGVEGYVTDVTWRYTSLRQLSDNLVVIPNSKLGSATFVNFSRPAQEMSVTVELGVAYDSDLELVEDVTRQVAEEVSRDCEDAVGDFEPIVRFGAFGPSSIAVTVVLRVHEYAGQWPVRHEFVKRLHARYAKEGIEIPFPVTTVRLEDPSHRSAEPSGPAA